MWVPRKACGVLARIIVSEIIHHEKRVGLGGVTKSEDSMQVNAGTFHCWLGD
jgi:hypothetical protein